MFSYLSNVCGRIKVSVIAVLLGFICIGCGQSNAKRLLVTPVTSQKIAPEPVVDALPNATTSQKIAPRNLVDVLLEQADTALRKGRLVSPEHDNAFDCFQSVLILDDDNSVARSGLQAILVGMSNDVRSAITAKHFYSARKQLTQLDIYFPTTALVEDLQRELRVAQSKERARVEVDAPPPQGDYEDIALSVDELARRSEVMQQQLQSVADKIVANKYMVMIYARSDSEGRWIYKQLKQGAEGYRVRGDIRIGKPKLRLLPPL